MLAQGPGITGFQQLVAGQGCHSPPPTVHAAATTKHPRPNLSFCTLHTPNTTHRPAGAAHHCGALMAGPGQLPGLGLMVDGAFKCCTPRSVLILMQRTGRILCLLLPPLPTLPASCVRCALSTRCHERPFPVAASSPCCRASALQTKSLQPT